MGEEDSYGPSDGCEARGFREENGCPNIQLRYCCFTEIINVGLCLGFYFLALHLSCGLRFEATLVNNEGFTGLFSGFFICLIAGN